MACFAATALILAGCVPNTPTPNGDPKPAKSPKVEMIPLQNGDQIEVDLSGTPTPIPPLQMTLNGSGDITLPNLDTSIHAIGK